MKCILLIQAIIAATSSICHVLYKPKHHWPEVVAWWLTFFTLYSNLMPISLYPTVEFCNVFQCRAIQQDKRMTLAGRSSCYKAPGFNEGKPFAAVTRSSNLCQELGQVGYIFSDKTGTLTQNDMALRRVSIGGQKFGTFQSSPQAGKSDDAGWDGFDGGRELQAARGLSMKAREIDAFLEVLAVSHTVMVTSGEDLDECSWPSTWMMRGLEKNDAEQVKRRVGARRRSVESKSS
ncbi:unnamed protein product [Symbiodinium sp. CCMP2592]|nr:unnamed protein product [Symbiodinium sp. CCMP2592]